MSQCHFMKASILEPQLIHKMWQAVRGIRWISRRFEARSGAPRSQRSWLWDSKEKTISSEMYWWVMVSYVELWWVMVSWCLEIQRIFYPMTSRQHFDTKGFPFSVAAGMAEAHTASSGRSSSASNQLVAQWLLDGDCNWVHNFRTSPLHQSLHVIDSF